MGSEGGRAAPGRTIATRGLWALFLFLLAGARPAEAIEHAAVPVNVQIPILLKAITYDRTLGSRVGDDFLFAAVYRPRVAESERAVKAFEQSAGELEGKTLLHRPLRRRLIAWEGKQEFLEALREDPPDVIYLMAGCERILDRVLEISADEQITTLAAVPEFVEKGATLGVGERDGRPEIIVNLTSSKREGARFSSDLLRLCRVLR